MNLDAMKAEFAARGGKVTVAQEGETGRCEYDERAHERYAESVREAAHAGGRRAALEALQGDRHQDYTRYDR
jgi:hypothetical protein